MTAPFILQNISEASPGKLSRGTYIVLFHAKRIPPHLLVLHDGRTWDLSVKGSRKGDSLEILLHYIERKNVISLFIEWKMDAADFAHTLDRHFSKYEKIEAGKNSCLFPIRDVAAELYGADLNDCEFIFNLLPAMDKMNALGNCYAANLNSSSFEVLTYDQQQLEESIREAQNRNINTLP